MDTTPTEVAFTHFFSLDNQLGVSSYGSCNLSNVVAMADWRGSVISVADGVPSSLGRGIMGDKLEALLLPRAVELGGWLPAWLPV